MLLLKIPILDISIYRSFSCIHVASIMYFQLKSCQQAWCLLTEIFKLPTDKLYVTYFEGDELLNLPADTQTRNIWLEIGYVIIASGPTRQENLSIKFLDNILLKQYFCCVSNTAQLICII